LIAVVVTPAAIEIIIGISFFPKINELISSQTDLIWLGLTASKTISELLNFIPLSSLSTWVFL
jgi:hypothetical protein